VGRASSLQRIHNHSDAPHLVGLLWTSDQPDAETSTWQHTTLKTDIQAFGGIRSQIPASERSQNYTLDRAASGIGLSVYCRHIMKRISKQKYGCHNSKCSIAFLLRKATIDNTRTSPSYKEKKWYKYWLVESYSLLCKYRVPISRESTVITTTSKPVLNKK
jgi:hypothetical protein